MSNLSPIEASLYKQLNAYLESDEKNNEIKKHQDDASSDPVSDKKEEIHSEENVKQIESADEQLIKENTTTEIEEKPINNKVEETVSKIDAISSKKETSVEDKELNIENNADVSESKPTIESVDKNEITKNRTQAEDKAALNTNLFLGTGIGAGIISLASIIYTWMILSGNLSL